MEFDTKANMRYDANGLGRVHKQGAPSTICLSLPCCANPRYVLDMEEAVNISLCPGCISNGEPIFAENTESCYELTSLEHSDTNACAVFEVTLPNSQKITAAYVADASGVTINVTGEGEVVHMLPVFAYDGETASVIKGETKHLIVTYQGFCCSYTTDGEIVDTGKVGGNRNGHYRRFYAKGTNNLAVKIEIKHQEAQYENY